MKIWTAVFVLALLAGYAHGQTPMDAIGQSGDASAPINAPILPPPGHVQLINPAGGLLGFQHGQAGSAVPLATLAHIRGMRVNHLVGHGLVVGLQNTGDTQQTLFSIQFLLNTLRHESITIPSSLNPANIQVRNLAAAMVTVDLPPFTRVGSRVDTLVSAMGDARSLQGGTLLITPMHGADGRVYALAQGPITIEGYFAGAAGGASSSKNFQTSGLIPGGSTLSARLPTILAKTASCNLISMIRTRAWRCAPPMR